MASKPALVTGGSGGIGRAIALALGGAGHPVAITGRNEVRLAAIRDEIEELGVEASYIVADLRDPDAPEQILATVDEELGELPGILVNNAGTAPTAKFDHTDDAMLEEVLDLHVRAPFRLIRSLLPHLRVENEGVLVQLASSAGLRGFPYTAAYTAAKHAMVGMTRALALDIVGTGLRTYAICPGFVDTEITRSAAEQIASRGKQTVEQALAAMAKFNRIGRMHTSDEVAACVLRMCRDLPAGHVYDLDSDPPRFVD
ncbi:MAG: SDR family oxidoreductase [Planctomycetes bacterium]|nr:SDR family oxidoreductase [Planctomycetota bacterium]